MKTFFLKKNIMIVTKMSRFTLRKTFAIKRQGVSQEQGRTCNRKIGRNVKTQVTLQQIRMTDKFKLKFKCEKMLKCIPGKRNAS